MQVKCLYESNKITTSTFLRYQFLGKSGFPIDLQKIENLQVLVIYKGVPKDITNDCQKVFSRKQLSVYVSPQTIKELFGKRNVVCRIVINWNYKNNPKQQTFTHNLKFMEDNNSMDIWKRTQKKEKRGKRGKKSKNHQKRGFYENIGFISV